MKYWIKPNIENRIKNGEITAYFQLAKLPRSGRIRSQSRRPEGEVELKNDFVFAMIGYQPDLQFLALDGHHASSPRRSGRCTNPETLESERKGIYLAGVIVAGMHTNEIFIENGRFHGKKIADAIASSIQ